MVEILTVLVIVGVLIGLGFPMLNRFRNQARASACMVKLKQVGVAVNLYSADHGLKFPNMAAARNSKLDLPEDDEFPTMDILLKDYVRDEFVFECPADHGDFFEDTGTSYFWNSLVNGQMIGNMDLLGLSSNEAGIPLVSDKENFHKHLGHEVNILYADGHIDKQLQFIVNE